MFVTGIGLLIVGPTDRNPMLLLHKVTFIVWVVFMSLHILGHLPALASALGVGGAARGGMRRNARGPQGDGSRWPARWSAGSCSRWR